MTVKISSGLANGLLSGDSFKALVEGGDGGAGFLIDIYSGARPASPDLAATGTKLVTLSAAGAGTGLHLASAAAGGALAKASAETWQGTGLANGTAGYFRLRTGADTGGAESTTAIRVDGTVATSGGDLNMTSVAVASGAPYIVSAAGFNLTNPA